MQAVARNPWLNKQNLTNGIALALVILGLALPHEDGNPWLSMGLFAVPELSQSDLKTSRLESTNS